MGMKEFKDMIAKEMYGRTITEAHDQVICVCCGESMYNKEPLAPVDAREWKISGLCPNCFPKG